MLKVIRSAFARGIILLGLAVTAEAVFAAVPIITETSPSAVLMDEDGSPTAFSLTLNATDADGDTLTWSISSAATNGSASATGTGTSKVIGYTPNANYNGADSFTVQVSDGTDTDSHVVNVTIAAQNDGPPVITETSPSAVLMDEDGSPTAFSLTLNATDADGDTLTWSISSAATNGTASATGTGASKVIGYTPNANYNGADSFTVQVSDGTDTDSHVVNVTINPQNDPPTANAGLNQIVVVGSTVTLDGAGSSDDGTITNYAWTETTSTGVSLTGNGTAAPTFTAPAAPATVTFSLVVTDDEAADSTTK